MNMGQFKDRKAVSNLLKEAILQLCRVSVGMQGDFTIDGIICIGSNDDADEEFIVKIHEKAVCSPQNATQSGGIEFPKNIPTAVIPVNSCANTLVNTTHTDIPSHSRLPFPNNNNKKQHIIDYLTGDSQMAPALDNDVEILDIPSVSSQKHMYGDIDNFSDIECTGYDFDEMSFSDVVIKPDPGMYNKISRNSMASQKTSNSGDESSDEELKIETLKAGRVRKPNKTAYTDMDGAPVQVLSAEEFKRILKSEKLKRSRDKSPDFVYGAKALRTSSDPSTVYRRQMLHRIAVKAPDREPEESQSVNAPLPQTMVSSASNMAGYKLPQHHGKQALRTFASNMVALTPGSHLQNDVNVSVSKEIDSNVIDSQSRSSIEGDNKISIISASLRQSQMIPAQKKIPNVSLSNRSQGEKHQTVSSMPVCSTTASESLLKHNYSLLPQVGQQSLSGDAVNVICLDAVNKATQSKPHECPICAGVFDTFRHLDLHMYKLHPGMFLCPVCGKSFKQRSTRNRHIVALHSSEKNFVCHICNLSFTRTDTLKKHFDASHPDVACPKKSYSYAKGMSIFSTNDQVLVSNGATVQEDQCMNQSVASGETKHGLYTDNFITPIQVTAAVENTDQVPSTVIPPNASSITNITPYHTESVLESGERFQARDNSQLKDPVVQKHMLTDDMAASTDNMKDTLSGMCSSMSSDQVTDSTIISLHSVTHIKPIDLTKQFGGITQQCVQKMSQQTSASVNFVHNENTDIGNINTGAAPMSNVFVNQKEAAENKKFVYPCNNTDSLEQMYQSGHSNVAESTTEVNGSSDGKNDHSKIKEDSIDQVQLEPNSVLGLVSDGQDEQRNEQSGDALSAKDETDENQTSCLDTIEISDEDNTEHL